MVKIVVAKYNENLDWIKKVTHNVTIYDKSENPIEVEGKEVLPLKNVGREGETFLYHIVHNYDNLDDVTIFLQGNPFEHLQLLVGWRAQLTDTEINMVIDKINKEITDNSSFSTFYQVLYNDQNGVNGVNTTEACINYYGEYYHSFTVSPGAQYIVPKTYILSRPLEFWKKLHYAMYNNELNGYCQEQLWYLAFTHKMNTNVGNHDEEKKRCIDSIPNMNNTPYSYFIKQNINIC
jgi:hypothetical protein